MIDCESATDLLPCGERSLYIPYRSRSSTNFVRIGNYYIEAADMVEMFPGLIVVSRSGPAHGWRCWAVKDGERWEANYHPLANIPEDAPRWAKEALSEYYA